MRPRFDRDNHLHLREIAFTGRRTELSELSEALGSAFKGRGFTALVAGEPGMGKTRLVDELGKTASDRGATVAWGHCWEAGGTPAYWPWIQILRSIAGQLGVQTVERAVAERVGDLAPVLPELARAHMGPTAVSEPTQARFRLFEGVARLLRTLSSEAPLVVAFDDLHSADISSLLLLEFIARELRSMRTLVIGTYREQEARASRAHMDLITRIARSGAVFPLNRLAPTEVEVLVRGEWGDRADDELIASLERSSEGNPLFLGEMLRLIAARNAKLGTDRHLLPDTVRELIRARLDGIDERTRNLVEFASVFGRDFSAPLLLRVANLSQAAVRQGLEEAEHAGLISDLGAERWSFAHILIREVSYSSIPVALRARLHAALASALEASSDDSASSLASIAHHRLLGAAESGIRQAVESALTLSRRALGVFAFEDVVHVLESALRLLEAEPDEVGLRYEALTTLGEACIRSGDRVRGKQYCRTAAELARAKSDAEGMARAALAYGSEISMGEVDPSLVGILEAALDAIGEKNQRLRARVTARLAAARQPAKDTSEPMALAREAIALARRTGDAETVRAVIHYALAALVDYAEPDEVLPLCQESIALATAAGDRSHLLRAYGRLVFASLEVGDVVRADAAISAHESLARELPPALYLPDALMMRAMRALMEGRFVDADRFVERARELRDPEADPFTRAGALFHDAARDLVQERADRALERSAAAVEVWQIIPEVGVDYVHAFQACAHARLGDLDGARRHLDAIAEDATIVTGEPQGQRIIAEAIATVGDARRAALLEPRLEKMARRVMTWGRMVMVCDAPMTRLLGLLAGAQGRRSDAITLLEDALGRARAMGHVAILPRLGYELARELVRGSSGEELDMARELISEATEQAISLGYDSLRGKLEELARRLPGSSSAPASAPAKRQAPSVAFDPSSFTLVREGEVYAMSHGGRTARLKDSLGLRLLERLLASPGREIHVLELVGATGSGLEGDTGELLDERAINEYRRRLDHLRETESEAEELGDFDRRARARAEIDALADELARGVGLGGRGRRAGAASERARINVQRRLRDAIGRIDQQLSDLGRHLTWAVKTGVFCSYSPDRHS